MNFSDIAAKGVTVVTYPRSTVLNSEQALFALNVSWL